MISTIPSAKLKHPHRVAALVLALLGLMAFVMALLSGAPVADADTGRTASQDAYSEFARSSAGILVNWDAVIATPESAQIRAQLAQLPSVPPLIESEAMAAALVKYMGTTAYTGTFHVASPDQGACVVGELVRGFAARSNISLDTQYGRNTMQSLVYLQFGVHEANLTVDQAWGKLQDIAARTGEWPPSVKSFEMGLTDTAPVGFKVCGY